MEVKKSLDTVDLNMSASLLSGDVLVWGRLALMRPGLLSRGDAILSSIGGEDNFTGAAMHTPLPRLALEAPAFSFSQIQTEALPPVLSLALASELVYA